MSCIETYSEGLPGVAGFVAKRLELRSFVSGASLGVYSRGVFEGGGGTAIFSVIGSALHREN